jgi:hypothetical protein
MHKFIICVLAVIILAPSAYAIDDNLTIDQIWNNSVYKPDRIKTFIKEVAANEGFNVDEFWLVAYGESGLNRFAVGDRGLSWGIWQIYSTKHNISKSCAHDIVCSTKFAVELWKQSPSNWTCWKELRGIQSTNMCGYKRG